MKRPVLVVLLLTFAALVVATLWVPVVPAWTSSGARAVAPFPMTRDRTWIPVWELESPGVPTGVVSYVLPGSSELGAYKMGPRQERHEPGRIVWLWLVAESALILAVGGLVALALHTRAKQRSVEA